MFEVVILNKKGLKKGEPLRFNQKAEALGYCQRKSRMNIGDTPYIRECSKTDSFCKQKEYVHFKNF